MSHLLKAQTANEVWELAATQLMSEQAQRHNGRGGATRELLHVMLTIHDPRQRWVMSRQPAINPAFAIAEIVWILNGRHDAAFLNHWNSQLPRYAGTSTFYAGAYGFRLRHHHKIDQLERAYTALLHNRDSRQVVLQIWDPMTDLPQSDGQPTNQDIPCNIIALLKVRGKRLEWTQILRSNDLFRGTPYNFVQWTSLHEIFAGWLGVEMGAYHQLSDSLHIYERDEKYVQSRTAIEIMPNTDSLAFPKKVSERGFRELNERMNAMLEPILSGHSLQKLSSLPHLPTSFQNMLRVVAADSARRRGWLTQAQDLMVTCTNPALIQGWERWLTRLSKAGRKGESC